VLVLVASPSSRRERGGVVPAAGQFQATNVKSQLTRLVPKVPAPARNHVVRIATHLRRASRVSSHAISRRLETIAVRTVGWAVVDVA
jgi:hypothetical protein